MSEDAKSVVAAREIYTACLQDFLTGPVMVGFASLYEGAKADTPDGRTSLRQFQIALSETPSWNQNRIDAEVKRICKDSSESYLEDLITTILVSNAEILSSINLHGKTNKIQLKIPKIGNFVHAVYVCVARRLYKEIYVFDEEARTTEKQRNMRRCEEIVREAILTVLQDNLPIHDIIRQYVTGGGDAREAIDEVSDLLEDPDVVPAEISPESVSIIEEDAGAQEGGEDTPDGVPDGEPEEASESAKIDSDDTLMGPLVEAIPHTIGLAYPVDSVGRVDRQIGREDDEEGPESDAEETYTGDRDGGELVAMDLPAGDDDVQAPPPEETRNSEPAQREDVNEEPVTDEVKGGDDTSGSIVIDISDIAGAGDGDDGNEAGDYDSEDAAHGSDDEALPVGGVGPVDPATDFPRMVITPKEGETDSEAKKAREDGDHGSTGPSNVGTDEVEPISDGEFEDYEFTDDELMSDRDDMGELIKRIKTGDVDTPSKAEVFFGDLVPKRKKTAELVQDVNRGKKSLDTKSKRASLSSQASSSDGGVTDGDSKRIILPPGVDPEASDGQTTKRPRRRAKKRIQLFPDAKSDTGAED
jgi:hypothetical protein